MDPIAIATWGLAGVTLLLVVFSAAQDLMIRRQSKRADERAKEQMALLGRQADALTASAEASQAMADEMLEARKAANPLRIRIDKQQLQPGAVTGYFFNDGDRAEILLRSELLVGSEAVTDENWGNAYLAPGSSGQYFSYRFPVGPSDLLTLRVTGRPQNGLVQSREFLYRIRPGGMPEDLQQNQETWSAV